MILEELIKQLEKDHKRASENLSKAENAEDLSTQEYYEDLGYQMGIADTLFNTIFALKQIK